MRKLQLNQIAFRRRARPIIAFFVLAQFVMLAVGMAGLECIDIVRAYSAGEARWSRADKSAIVALARFMETRRPEYFRDFERNMAVMTGDRSARIALELPAPDISAAERGFIEGQNDPSDVAGMAYGFLCFHNVPAFARAFDAWRDTDVLVAALERTGDDVRALAGRSGAPADWEALRVRALAIDRGMTVRAAAFSQSIGIAARFSKVFVAATYLLMALLACVLWVWRVRAIVNAGADAERRVIEHQERLSDFVELASDWFCELDGNMDVAFVSGNFPAPDAKTPDWSIGRSWLETFRAAEFEFESGPQISGMTEALAAHTAFRGGAVRQVLADGGERHWSLAGKPLFDDDRFAGYRISANDVSNFIDAQTKLVGARDEAERANKAKSSFLANMGHELRTPLNAILGFSEVIEGEMVGAIGDPHYVEYARDIGVAGRQLLAIINGLLDQARIESGKLELHEQPFDLGDIVRAVELLCRDAAIRNNTKLTLDLPAYLPMILGDELRIRQSLINLVSNAIKFSPDGIVDVSVFCDDAIAIRVRDTGIGMTRAELARALEPFGQVDCGFNRKFEGTGLGLPLTRGLIKLHGGELTLESEPGVGTTVTITLPVSRIAQRAKSAA